jgi:arylsulfatase A-like enzyme
MKRPNVLLIVMDATRFDVLSAYGYPQPTTPNLERLAADGVLFENAFASAPWTPPSHASLFTGTYPSVHGVDVNENLYLGEKNRTLAEILSGNGYRSFAVLPDAHLSSNRGFHRGFQEYIETWKIPYLHLEYDWLVALGRNVIVGKDKRSYYTSRVVRRWLRNHDSREKPFFVFVNYKTAHNSYPAPRPYRKAFEVNVKNVDRAKALYYSKKGGYSYIARRLELTEEEFLLVKSWYCGAVAYMDSQIGSLIDHLKQAGAYDDTLVIVTADHGECFGEHHLAYHLFCLYDALIHVPLIMSCPSLLPKGKKVSEMVSLTDVLPTIMEVLNSRESQDHLQGTSLVPFDGRSYHDEVYAEFGRPLYMLKRLAGEFPGHNFQAVDRALQCIRTKDYKLIVGSDGSEEIYNLRADPLENHNRLGELPEVAADLRARLNLWRSSMDVPLADGHVEEDEKVVKALRDLGYF